MSTNHKPVIRGTDVGIWRRICLIPFTVCIPEEKIDKNLKFKLQRELSGILKWAVDGCLMWQREGLKQPAAVAAATAEYRSEMDVISAFIAECCETGTGEEWDHDLYEAYVKWAKENNEYEMSSRKFNTEMLKKFERRKTNSKRYFQNVSLILSCKIYHGVQFKNV